jgi:hypothetical protein
VEGAVLLVDATKGIQAQTLANLEIAQKQNLVIIPAINKIDSPQADVEKTTEELANLLKIETCDNSPDDYHFTWDFRNAFTSICNETSDSCTTGNSTIIHTCSKDNCTAECDQTHSCDNKCVGQVRYYSGNCNLASCNCSFESSSLITLSIRSRVKLGKIPLKAITSSVSKTLY